MLKTWGLGLVVFLFGWSAAATPLVTGNGFGYAIVQPSGEITKLYAHPYRFERPNEQNPTGDGIETANLIRHAMWKSAKPLQADYLNESSVIVAQNSELRTDFFMPFAIHRNLMITTAWPIEPSGPACMSVTWQNKVTSSAVKKIGGMVVRMLHFEGVNESLGVWTIGATGIQLGTEKFCGQAVVFLVLENDGELADAVAEFNRWRASVPPGDLGAREVNEFDRWRVTPRLHFHSTSEKALWRQSETILRVAQIREPYREGRRSFGLINASLPDGEWFIPWVRDMSYSTVALAESGHRNEARAALDAFLNAGPAGKMIGETRGIPYAISTVRYFGDGSEEADHSGQPLANIEFDSWGLALWAIGRYHAVYHDVAWLSSRSQAGTVYETMRDLIVKPLVGNLDSTREGSIVAADTSIWEQNSMPRLHYAFSTIAAIKGLREFFPVAVAMKDEATAKMIKDQVAALEKGFQDSFVTENGLKGTLEDSPKNDIDGALLEGLNLGLAGNTATIQKTLDRLELLRTVSGGYRRVLGATPYELQEFLFVNFSLARLYLRFGEILAADAIVHRILGKAQTDHNLIPEMYLSVPDEEYNGSAIGDPVGATPMVGYGAGLYMIYLTERESAVRGIQ